MGSYYYAVASLPFLRFDGDKYPSNEEFLEVCSQWSSEKEYSVIAGTGLEPNESESRHPLLVKYHDWETGLRNELVRQRALELNRDGQNYIHRNLNGDDFTARSGLSEAVRSAIQSGSPLEADEALDRLRWEFIDQLEIGQFYNLEQLIVYYLRLQILLRRRSLSAVEGREAFSRHYKAVHSQMQEIQNDNGEQA